MILIIFILRKSAFFNKMQQMQIASKVKKKETEKKTELLQKNKILHNLDRTPDGTLKVREKFLGCCGYLPKGKSIFSPTSPIFSLSVTLFNN